MANYRAARALLRKGKKRNQSGEQGANFTAGVREREDANRTREAGDSVLVKTQSDPGDCFQRKVSMTMLGRMGEGCGRAATGDARGVAAEEARSRKATEGICGEVINAPCDSLRYRS
jgi:hypothetical protein